MTARPSTLDTTIVGGGMITYDLLLPSLYHLQRAGIVGNIAVCALNSAPLKALKDNKDFHESFPGQEFTPYPSLSEPEDRTFPELYKDVITSMAPGGMVVVAMPDNLHYPVIMDALHHDQNVLCVKPLVLQYDQAVEIEKLAAEKGRFVGVEYHKRFDRRSLVARRGYGLGQFGAFVIGEAKLIEPYYYRSSNFQNWFTCDRTDPFTYIGCHYVDLVYFITGLKPQEVSVKGVRRKFPNGNEAFMWSHARVTWENGGLLSIVNGLGYPDDAAGSNDQGMVLYCEGENQTGLIFHDDHNRGVAYSYLEGIGPGGSKYNYISPDFYRLVHWEGPGYKPIGYGYESVAGITHAIHRLENETRSLPPEAGLRRRREMIHEVDARGLIATPANSYINELVVEAARMSILRDAAPVRITYGKSPRVDIKEQFRS
ncbi:MAG TPA: Gfo/Idh/MocA family oxidoreductase [Acidobacteriota bacterium]|nr:Gfo/Idh/MocA family oxidoreductase [Acidobacteriota bacterium]